MDFTETPHAEDFAMETGEIIEEYYRRGLSIENMTSILEDILEDYKIEIEDE